MTEHSELDAALRGSIDGLQRALSTMQNGMGVMTTNVAVLTEATRDLKDQVKLLREDTITRVEFEALQKQVDGHSAIFGRLTWVIVLVVVGALLGLVVQGGIST